MERLRALLELAPKFKAKIEDWLSELDIKEPSWDDYMEFDQDYYLGLATILKEVIAEAEGIDLTACDNYDSIAYLLYQPMYPWDMSESDRGLTKEKVAELFRRYASILTDTPIEVDDQAVENGG